MGRRLGQHFLTDPAILDRLVDALSPDRADIVVEIGPGRGSLTRRLAPRVGVVVAIERDPVLADALRAVTGGGGWDAGTSGRVNVVDGDALDLDWHGLARRAGPGAPFKLAGNIPYAITSPLIAKALTPPLPAVIVFLVQREVAERVAALPGSKAYGALTIGVQALARVERLFAVRAGAFHPPPRVDSAALRLTPRPDPLVLAPERAPFERFVKALFGQRRKQLRRSLRDVMGVSRDAAERLLEGLGIDGRARPELLAPQDVVRLYRAGPR